MPHQIRRLKSVTKRQHVRAEIHRVIENYYVGLLPRNTVMEELNYYRHSISAAYLEIEKPKNGIPRCAVIKRGTIDTLLMTSIPTIVFKTLSAISQRLSYVPAPIVRCIRLTPLVE